MKPGIKTSELWLVVAISAIALLLNLAGYSADEVRQYGEISISRLRGAIIEWLPLVLSVAYIIQRAVLKVADIWLHARLVSAGQHPLAEELEVLRKKIQDSSPSDA